MELYHIAAMAENRVIGNKGKLPWHFSEDLKRFKKLTMGSTIVMGRKTFDSIGGKPLSGRENFVLSRGVLRNAQNLKFFRSLDDALASIKTEKAFIIGGASLYDQTMKSVDGIYLTQIKEKYDGDTYYPEIPAHFKVVGREKSNENPELEFITYRKRRLF
jgi:dihydrofolate reductase